MFYDLVQTPLGSHYLKVKEIRKKLFLKVTKFIVSYVLTLMQTDTILMAAHTDMVDHR